jgi:hypothetical protein
VTEDYYGFRSPEFDDFESWTARLAVRVLVEDALADREVVASMAKKRVRVADVREALSNDESVLARVRIEQDRLARDGDVVPLRRIIPTLPLNEYVWLLFLAVAGIGYLSLLSASWSAMPLLGDLLAGIGLCSVVALSGAVVLKRAPTLVANLAKDMERGSTHPHEQQLRLGNRRTFVLNEIVLPVVREFVRSEGVLRYGVKLQYTEINGLYDESETKIVLTAASRRLRRIIERADSGAVALAGHRGVGKTTSIRAMRHGLLKGTESQTPLVVMASAPAHYDARDFVLHLLASLCEAVMTRVGRTTRDLGSVWKLRRMVGFTLFAADCASGALVLWHGAVDQLLRHIAGGVADLPATVSTLWSDQPAAHRVALALLGLSAAALIGTALYLPCSAIAGLRRRRQYRDVLGLRRTAREQLARTQFLQTHTTGWAGKLTMPLKGEASRTWSLQRAEQQLTHPAVVDELRRFAQESARVLRESGVTDRVVIAIDELDKIGEQEKANQFVNDIKGVFGVPGCLFFVSVSDDAITNFEQRGQGVRDAFDSAFAEMVRLEPFTLDESRHWVALRLTDVPEQFCYLCHCLSGGLPRDLRRYTTDMVDLTTDFYQPSLAFVADRLVRTELTRTMHALSRKTITLGSTSAYVALTAQLLAIPDATDPLELVEQADRLPRDATDEEPDELTTLRWHGASAVMFAATVLETFTDDLDKSGLNDELHQLAIARRLMSVYPRLTWQPLQDFRKTRGLTTNN